MTESEKIESLNREIGKRDGIIRRLTELMLNINDRLELTVEELIEERECSDNIGKICREMHGTLIEVGEYLGIEHIGAFTQIGLCEAVKSEINKKQNEPNSND